MIDYKTKYLDARENIEVIASSIMDKDSIDSFSETVEKKIQDFKPSLMLYGTYNSGKSTLLNALYGQEEKAKTGDLPETCTVTPYDWNGYTIYDTPGIDAPQEHDELTQKHLDKTEIVLFIVSNDGAFEEDYIYEKLADIVSISKPLVFVLNNKTGANELELNQTIVSINKKLIDIGDRRGINQIETKVKILFVDAQTALDGKLENEQLLIEDSNIEVIENEIDKLFIDSGMGEVVANLNRYFKQYIESLIEKVNHKIDNALAKELEKQIVVLSNENIYNASRLKLQIEKESEYIGNDVKALLLDGSDEQILNNFIDDRTQIILEKMKNEIEHISDKVQERENIYIDSLEDINIKINGIKALQEDEKKDGSFSIETKKYLDQVGDVVLEGLRDEKMIAESSKEVLLKLRELGVKGFKGKWEKTLGKTAGKIGETAGKIGKWAGPAVKVAMAGYNIYKSEKEYRQMLQQKRDYTQSAQNEANKLVHSINESFSSQLNILLDEIYSPLIKNKRKMIAKIIDKDNMYTILNEKLLTIKLEFM